jgi:hypothetical protein
MAMPSDTLEYEATPAQWTTCNKCGYVFKLRNEKVDMRDFYAHKSTHIEPEFFSMKEERD